MKNFKVIGLQGINTDSEITATDLNRLIKIVCTNKIPMIFPETSTPHRHITALQEGCKDFGHYVKIGKELFSDALNVPNSFASTYEEMLLYNIQQITQHSS